jgi:Kef-type K+ transport system membrane component KefB
MKNLLKPTLLIVISAFAALTLFLTTSIIFDLFGIREAEGNFVWGIIGVNFVASWLYLASVYGSIKQKSWSAQPLLYASILILFGIGYLAFHAFFGGLYELKTFQALAFRGSLSFVLYWLMLKVIKKENGEQYVTA